MVWRNEWQSHSLSKPKISQSFLLRALVQLNVERQLMEVFVHKTREKDGTSLKQPAAIILY